MKKLVATHDKIDPAMVTSDDLVRALRQNEYQSLYDLAHKMGFRYINASEGHTNNDEWEALYHVVFGITLPEERGEPLPFDDAINGWRGEE